MKRKAIARKCKKCIEAAKHRNTAAINTATVSSDYFRKAIKESCKEFDNNIINIIMDFMHHTECLDGTYLYTDEQNEYTLRLRKNLTFKWTSSHYAVTGLYKCFKGKNLKFEGIKVLNHWQSTHETLVEFKANIIYKNDTIQIKSEIADSPSKKKRVVFKKEKEHNYFDGYHSKHWTQFDELDSDY